MSWKAPSAGWGADMSTVGVKIALISAVVGVLLLSAPWVSTGSQTWDSYVMCHPDLPDEPAALQFATNFLHQEYGDDLTQHFGATSAVPHLPFRVGTAAAWDTPAAASYRARMDAVVYPDTWIVTNAVYSRAQWPYSDGGIEIYVGKHAGCTVRTHVVG